MAQKKRIKHMEDPQSYGRVGKWNVPPHGHFDKEYFNKP
jgi:hypothetical protein